MASTLVESMWSPPYHGTMDGEKEAGPSAPVIDQAAIEAAYRAARMKLGRLGVSAWDFGARVRCILEETPSLVDGVWDLAMEDIYLAMGCQRRNEQAWLVFDRSFRSYLGRLCSRVMGSYSEGEELLADLYSDLLSRPRAPGKIEMYRGMASLGTWLSVIIRRMALDRLRHAERRINRERRYEQGMAPADPRGPESSLLRTESREIGARVLKDALEELEPRHRLVLRLMYWDGLTLREAGRVMGLDYTTVSRRAKNARQALRKKLQRISRKRYGLGREGLSSLMEHVSSVVGFDPRQVGEEPEPLTDHETGEA